LWDWSGCQHVHHQTAPVRIVEEHVLYLNCRPQAHKHGHAMVGNNHLVGSHLGRTHIHISGSCPDTLKADGKGVGRLCDLILRSGLEVEHQSGIAFVQTQARKS